MRKTKEGENPGFCLRCPSYQDRAVSLVLLDYLGLTEKVASICFRVQRTSGRRGSEVGFLVGAGLTVRDGLENLGLRGKYLHPATQLELLTPSVLPSGGLGRASRHCIRCRGISSPDLRLSLGRDSHHTSL